MTSLERINEAALNAARTMPVMQNSLLTALGYYLGGQGKARQEKAQSQYHEDQLGLERQRLDHESALDDRARIKFEQDQTDRQTQLAQDATIKQQDAGLKPLPIKNPAAYAKMPLAQRNAMQIAYLRVRQREAQAKNNPVLFTQTEQQIASLQAEIDKAQRDALQEAETARILSIQPQQFQQGLGVREQGLNDANIRSANAITAAMNRLNVSENAQDTRQQRGEAFQQGQQGRAFGHSDKAAAIRAKAEKEKAAKNGKLAPIDPIHLQEYNALKSNPLLPFIPGYTPQIMNLIQLGIYKSGEQATIRTFQSIASGQVKTADVTPEMANAALRILTKGK